MSGAKRPKPLTVAERERIAVVLFIRAEQAEREAERCRELAVGSSAPDQLRRYAEEHDARATEATNLARRVMGLA